MTADTLRSRRRPGAAAVVVMVGGATVVLGVLLALVQSAAPYTRAGGVMAVGMFVLGIGVGGLLFTPRARPTAPEEPGPAPHR